MISKIRSRAKRALAQFFQWSVGTGAYCYVRAVRSTCRLIISPKDYYSSASLYVPCIIASWHGQSYMLPFISKPGDKVRVLTSKHRDGQYYAHALRGFNIDVILGSGAGPRPSSNDMIRKRGLVAFQEMLDTLASGYSMALTADVPKRAKIVGNGILKLAYRSGRAIIPMAAVTDRRRVLQNWDRTTINCLFSRRLAIVIGEPIFVLSEKDFEAKRMELESALNAVNTEAVSLADN